LSQQDINQLNRSIKNNKIEAVIKSLPEKKSLELHGFTVKFYQNFKEEPTIMLLKLLHNVEKEGMLLTYSRKPVLL
jgi:hypothetical protein